MRNRVPIRTADAVLYADVHGHDERKPPVILVHGLGGRAASWGVLAPALGESRPTIVPDLRGCGESHRGERPLTLPLLGEDLLAVVETLKVPRVHLIGHSLGGVIVQQFLVDHAVRCLGAVLISTSSVVGEKATKNWRKLADLVESRGAVGDGGASRAFSAEFAASHPELVAHHSALAATCPARVYAEQARAASSYDYTDRLRTVTNPVLVLQGLADRMTSPGGSVLLDRALPCSRLEMIEAAGHNLHLEAPATVFEMIRAFLDAHDAG
jgi:3-oxoadipate enol-lactonase